MSLYPTACKFTKIDGYVIEASPSFNSNHRKELDFFLFHPDSFVKMFIGSAELVITDDEKIKTYANKFFNDKIGVYKKYFETKVARE